MGPFGQLLTMVAAALVPFHVSFRLPEADRKALVGTSVYEKKQTKEGLLLLKFRQEHLLSEQLPTVRSVQRDAMLGRDLLPSERVPNNHKNCNK